MPRAHESYVQVAADGSGKKIRNLVVERTLDNGTVVQEHMQIVALLDANGEPVDFDDERVWRGQVLKRLDLIAQCLLEMLEDDDDGDADVGNHETTELESEGTNAGA